MERIPVSSVREWDVLPGGIRQPKTIGYICPRCGEKVVFSLSNFGNDGIRQTISATAKCPACNKPIHFFVVRDEGPPFTAANNPSGIHMHPPLRGYYRIPDFPADIPEPLTRAFVSTIGAFNSKNYAATAVCGRRTLEGIFKYLVSEDKRKATLASLIELAKEQTDLAAPLTSLSHAIRDGGNLGAHFDIEKEPNEGIARQMVELLEYLISYLYVLPKQIRKLEESLEEDT